MKINVRKFQNGGAPVPEDPNAQAPAPAPEGGAPEEGGQEQDPLMMIAQAAAQALQSQDCNMAMQVCQAFMQLVQSQQGGAPEQAPEGQPVYRKGGKLVRRIND